MNQTSPIRGLQQPRSQFLVALDGGPDDALRQSVHILIHLFLSVISVFSVVDSLWWIYSTRMLPTVVVRRCRQKVSGVVTPSPVGVAILKLKYPSPPEPRLAMLGPFCTNRLVSSSRPIFVIASTLREWMIAVCLNPCSYFFAKAMAVSTSGTRTNGTNGIICS